MIISYPSWRGEKISEVVILKSRVRIELGDLNYFSQRNVQVMIVTHGNIGNASVRKSVLKSYR